MIGRRRRICALALERAGIRERRLVSARSWAAAAAAVAFYILFTPLAA